VIEKSSIPVFEAPEERRHTVHEAVIEKSSIPVFEAPEERRHTVHEAVIDASTEACPIDSSAKTEEFKIVIEPKTPERT